LSDDKESLNACRLHCTMRTSRRRQIFRLQLGVNRKLTAIRCFQGATVGVVRFRVTSPVTAASEGVEKSCRNKSRRSRRGQRRGKCRARGRQPREPPPPTRRDNGPSERSMNKHLRACDHFYLRQEQFSQLFKASQLYVQLKSAVYRSGMIQYDSNKYRVWKHSWRVLHDHILPFGEGVVWCSRIGPTFSYWLEQRFGIRVNIREQLVGITASAVLEGWLESRRIRDYVNEGRRVGKRSPRLPDIVRQNPTPSHEPHQFMRGKRYFCSWCQNQAPIWRLHSCRNRWERSLRGRAARSRGNRSAGG
jgi:hypothetical protein